MRSPSWKGNLGLAWDLARRDLASKYRRSSMGLVWLVLTPLGLLGIYAFVFGYIFGISWPATHDGESPTGFILPFFVGLAVYLVLSDVVNSSTTLYASKRTYVVKSPFPLWVLWAANLMRASVHAAINIGLVLVLALAQQRLSMTGAAWLLLGLWLCGAFIASLSMLLSALGPFIGDISDAMRLLLRVLFYATPITYPLAMVPEPYRGWMWLNPLTCMVEILRQAVVFGQSTSSGVLAAFAGATLLLASVSLWTFARVKGVVSDVV